MPFNRPSLTDIRKQVSADITANIPGADGLLRFSNLNVLGQTIAGLAYLHYGYLDWIAQQAVPFTAQDEFLEGWAALKNITRLAASPAIGSVTLTGTSGITVPAGTIVVRGDGYSYSINSSGTLSSGTVTIPITAVLPAIDPVNNPGGGGASGNASSGIVLSLSAAITGVQSSGVAATALTGGADVETDDMLRSRMLHAFQNPPQGGDQQDYITWALTTPGVTRAWVTPNGFGVGTVVVYVMFDISESSHNGFPQGTDGYATGETRGSPATGDQLAVANIIFPLQPVTALVSVVSPISHTVNFTIGGISSASTATKAAIAAAIANVFLTQGQPGGTIDISYIESAISAIAGTAGFLISSPAGNITQTAGQLPVVGTITYT